MKKRLSRYQLAANQRNGHFSTGPKTPNGKATSKMNALKHGLRSMEVVVRGRCIKENLREFNAFYEGLKNDLQPIGMMEEMLVQQIATTWWRLQRVLKAESGEIALKVDNAQWNRSNSNIIAKARMWELMGDPTIKMRESALGNHFMYNQLNEVRTMVEKEGYLTESAIQSVVLLGHSYSLTHELEKLRDKLQQNPEGLDESAFRVRQKTETLAVLNAKISQIGWELHRCENREEMEEKAQQAADVLPSPETLDKLIRYENNLQKKLYRAMNHLERLQRRREGENVPAPVVMEISNGS
jgi:hypothetical protein